MQIPVKYPETLIQMNENAIKNKKFGILALLALCSFNCAGEKPDNNIALLSKLRELKPLPKVHYSWRLENEFLDDRNNKLMYELARLTHSLCVAGEWVTSSQIDNCVYTCARINKTEPKIQCSIGIVYSPWHRKFMPKLELGKHISENQTSAIFDHPTYDAEIENFSRRSALIKHWVKMSNKKYGTDVKISAVLLDTERFYRREKDEKWNEMMRKALDAIHLKAVELFSNARIEWYGRGITGNGTSFSKTLYFTGKEIMPTLSCSLYTLPDMKRMMATFQKTYELADSLEIKEVTPWVALASGYKPDLIKKLKWTFNWDYDPVYSYQMGANLNNPEKNVSFNHANVIVFFPAPFNRNSSSWGKHLIAYVRGATGIQNLTDLGCDEN